MQPTIAAGDTLDFPVTGTNTPLIADYPPSAGWTLKYRLVPLVAGTAIEITASTDAGWYRITVIPSTTATYGLGAYGWSSWVEKTGYRHVIESGQVTVLPNPATVAAGTDLRAQAEKAIADLLAAMATYTASNGHVKEYEIAGRRMRFEDKSQITDLLNFWRTERTREKGRYGPIYLRVGRA